MDHLGEYLATLLGVAWLLPLASFTIIVFFGPLLGKAGKYAAYVATGAILSAFVLSFLALIAWLGQFGTTPETHHALALPANTLPAEPARSSAMRLTALAVEKDAHAAPTSEHGHEAHDEHHAAPPPKVFTGNLYSLGQFGSLKIAVSYYIDALTVAMFAMVTLIATCIHFYAIGYMHDELHEVTDHEVKLSDGHHLHRPGRFYRFFQYLSLFCFSMLGLVYAGNIAQVFVFWELVGICSYFLIGFYIERKSASNAANKAFIVNRVGDFGMIIGMMALWGSLGTFAFGDIEGDKPGIFSQVRAADNHYALQPPTNMMEAGAPELVATVVADHLDNPDPAAAQSEIESRLEDAQADGAPPYGYWLLCVGGIGIFCGCVGKSAQFPLHVWLPDAMEGPTPVSALVHSATMVAAGVYLVGRFFPVFTADVLIVIAYTGAITLFIAATIAITATDIKRVLAYSTVSQLGYMMLALGVGGWLAGMFHLITHAFFKSLLFMCSGSVIHACHTNEMPKMGGLRHKMPYTAYTMLVGCLAIAGAPFFSGFYSKDAILAQALSFANHNPNHTVLLLAVATGAAITAFYMFRLWYMTFAGHARDHHIFDHAHESPKVMYFPLVLLAVFALGAGWTLPFTGLSITNLLEQARPAGELHATAALHYPNEHLSHAPDIHFVATVIASGTALTGFLLATVFYCWKTLDPQEVRQQFAPLYTFLRNKWYFDELYDVLFVRPTMFLSGLVTRFDKNIIDGFINRLATWAKAIARFDDFIDRYVVDGLVNLTAHWTYSIARSLRGVQTGKLRQYVMLIVIGTVALTIIIKWSTAAPP